MLAFKIPDLKVIVNDYINILYILCIRLNRKVHNCPSNRFIAIFDINSAYIVSFFFAVSVGFEPTHQMLSDLLV